jgi:hypothetical protein
MLRPLSGSCLLVLMVTVLAGCSNSTNPSKPPTAGDTAPRVKDKGAGAAPIDTIPPPPKKSN